MITPFPETPERIRAEALYEELGGDLCICQNADVPHWCEKCQQRIALIQSAFRIEREDLTQRLTQSAQETEKDESLAMMHARKQSAANGFQDGWHAALNRVFAGDFQLVQDLLDLVPHYDAAGKVLEADAARDALQQQFDKLETQWREKAKARKADSRAANHDGDRVMDAYHDGKSMAYAECADDLRGQP